MVASTIDMKTRLQAKRMFLDAEQSFLNRTYYKPERTKNDE